MNLFYIESPFQLLSAYEAMKVFGEGKFVIRITSNNQNTIQMRNLVDILKLKHVEELYAPIQNINVLALIKVLFYRLKGYKRVFIGNYESGLLSLVIKLYKKKDIILLDDGAKSIYIQKRVFTQEKNYDIFTIFNKLKPYKDQKIYFNSFKNLKTLIKKENSQDNEILFIGTKLVEIGFIKEDEYLDILKKIYNRFKVPILYVAHREEDINKFKKIEEIEIKIKYLEYPIELYSLYNKAVPKNIISFYSTALISLQYLYDSNFFYIKYDFKNQNVKDVYEYFQLLDIKELKL